MTERPILFSAPMVNAILTGRKTQTRRVAKVNDRGLKAGFVTPNAGYAPRPIAEHAAYCPYGRTGELLWGRETWQYADWTEDGCPWVRYRADGKKRCVESDISPEWVERLTDIWAELSQDENYSIDSRAADRKWRPAIHMPRWACRLVLEIAAVRVERLQEISVHDVDAEGTPATYPSGAEVGDYRKLWESINGAGSWDLNPWVWVVEFKNSAARGTAQA